MQPHPAYRKTVETRVCRSRQVGTPCQPSAIGNVRSLPMASAEGAVLIRRGLKGDHAVSSAILRVCVISRRNVGGFGCAGNEMGPAQRSSDEPCTPARFAGSTWPGTPRLPIGISARANPTAMTRACVMERPAADQSGLQPFPRPNPDSYPSYFGSEKRPQPL